MTAKLAAAVAVARNGVIGRDGGLPWRQSSDLKTFRRITMGKPLIMGRRTFASIGKPLDGRDNIVVTRDPGFSVPGVLVAGTPSQAVDIAQNCARQRDAAEIMVIGGAEIYTALLPATARLYWTQIDTDAEGDARFPPMDWSDWVEISREAIPQSPKDDHPAALIIFDRVST